MNSTFIALAARLCLLAGVLFSVAGRAQAQVTLDSPFRFLDTNQGAGPFFGYVLTSKGSLGFGPDDGPVFGARYGIRISGPFTVEAELGYLPSTRTVLDTVPAQTTIRSRGETDLSLFLARGALRFNVTGARTWHGIQPFIAFGGGIASDVAGESSLELDDPPLPDEVLYDYGTSFAADFGAGIEWFPSRSMTLRIDGRNLLWRIETPTAFLEGDRGEINIDREWAQNFFLSVGVSLRF